MKEYNIQRSNWLLLSFCILLPFFIILIVAIIKVTEMRLLCSAESMKYEG